MSCGYHKVDMEHRPRREHYAYYTETLKVEYNMTAWVELDNFIEFCNREHYRPYPALICVVTQVVNSIGDFKMFRDQTGERCVWDHLVPNYTLFHPDDKTFSDCWSEDSEDFDTPYQNVNADLDQYRDREGGKARSGQPPDFDGIFYGPWVAFTAYCVRACHGTPSFSRWSP